MMGGAEEAARGQVEEEEEADIGEKSKWAVAEENKLNSDKCIDREGQRSHLARRRPDGGPALSSKRSAAIGQAAGKWSLQPFISSMTNPVVLPFHFLSVSLSAAAVSHSH